MNVFIKGKPHQTAEDAGDNATPLRNFQWFVNSDDALHGESYQGNIEDLAEFAKQAAHARYSFIFIVDAIDCAARRIRFNEKERKHIQKAIPYLLEETLLSDIDELLIVNDKAATDYIDVIAVEINKLQNELTAFNTAGINISLCLPEFALFDSSGHSDSWRILYKDGIFTLADASGHLYAIEEAHMALACELLSESFSVLPTSIELQVDADAQEQAIAAIAEPLQHLLQINNQQYGKLWQDKLRQAEVWNLLKGPFAKNLHWRLMLQQWRWVLAAVLLVFFGQSAFMALQAQQMDSENIAVRAQMESLIRQVIPQGNIVDHRRQLERELKKLSGGGATSSFILSFEKFGEVLDAAGIKTVSALNYEASAGEVRLDFLVDDYDSLQKIISAMKDKGLTAEIQNSNAQGESLRARLKITG